jgi:hypothetical protein
MITVVSQRTRGPVPVGAVDILVGRPSVLGNPFILGEDGTRPVVIAKFREWLGRQLADPNSAAAIELRRIEHAAVHGSVRLVCWCAPQACHADVIKEVVQRHIDTGHWSVA